MAVVRTVNSTPLSLITTLVIKDGVVAGNTQGCADSKQMLPYETNFNDLIPSKYIIFPSGITSAMIALLVMKQVTYKIIISALVTLKPRFTTTSIVRNFTPQCISPDEYILIT